MVITDTDTDWNGNANANTNAYSELGLRRLSYGVMVLTEFP